MRMIDRGSLRRLAAAMTPLLMLVAAGVPAAAGCEASVSLVDFGRLDLDRGGDVTGELIVTCDRPTTFSVVLSAGLGNFGLRKMHGDDGAELAYNLFVDPARRRIWGDGVAAGTQAIKGENNGRRPSIIPIYGVVPSRQKVLTGPYHDNLLVTLQTL